MIMFVAPLEFLSPIVLYVNCSVYGTLSMLTASFGGTPYFEGLDDLFDPFLTILSIVQSLKPILALI
jgi:hypothetical protein